MERELRLMKGNEAIAEAAIRAGVDGYFGYPITPQSEILEYLMETNASEKTGMVVLQVESEVAAINAVYAGAGCGKKVLTSSSSPGISLMQEGISYISGAELPCLIVNVVRAGPGLGTIQPSQGDYFQAVKGGGHGDYRLIVLAPDSVQEMADFVELGFDLAFKYRNPVFILTDGAIGQMMEKVYLKPQKPRSEEVPSWAAVGKGDREKNNIITSLNLDPTIMEKFNQKLIDKYNDIKKHEVRFEEYYCDDADYIIIAYGTSARVCKKAIQIVREQGIKAGLLRPITLFPFPSGRISEMANRVKGFLSVELNAGQMVEDVALAVNGKKPVRYFGRMGGVVVTAEEVVEKLKTFFIGGN